MTLYDEYREAHPIAAEPSEFRDIIEAEVKRALEWMIGRDKPLPAEAIKPGRYKMTQTTELMVDVVQGTHGLFVMSDYYNLPIEQFCYSNVTFQAVGEKI
jgi:hypothetical protein